LRVPGLIVLLASWCRDAQGQESRELLALEPNRGSLGGELKANQILNEYSANAL